MKEEDTIVKEEEQQMCHMKEETNGSENQDGYER